MARSRRPLRCGAAVFVACVACLTVAVPDVAAQSDTTKTTFSKIYSEKQAAAGKDVYAGLCQGCHTEESHTGPVFQSAWIGKPLWDLFHYMQTEMPKTEPGSLTPEQYGQVLAYLLKLNAMPAGDVDLPVDSVALKAIRFDTVSAAAARKPNR